MLISDWLKPVVIRESIITQGDIEKLEGMGVAAVFSPSYSDSEIIEIINQIAQAWG
jgi:methylmalonyl-CoA mutase cobalamin-binding subunit